MADNDNEIVARNRRNFALGSSVVVALGSIGGLGLLAGVQLGEIKSRSLVAPISKQLIEGVSAGDYDKVVGALHKAKYLGILDATIVSLSPYQEIRQENMPAKLKPEDQFSELKTREAVKNFKSAMALRSHKSVYQVLMDAKSDNIMESMIDELSRALSQQKSR